MEGSHHFSVPNKGSEGPDFEAFTKLPEHLDELFKISNELGATMNPVMRAVIDYTNKMALRSAAQPLNN